MKRLDLEGLEEDGADPVTLFEVKAPHGPPWSFDLTTLDIEQTDLCDDDGQPAHGMTHYTKRRALVNAADPIWFQHETTMHELLHVLLDSHGIDWLTPDREEMLVQFLSPRLYGALAQVGFKWPKRSKEANALCRKAVLDSS